MNERNERIDGENGIILTSLRKLLPYFDDATLTDIFVNVDGEVSVKRFGKPIEDENLVLSRNERRTILIQIAKYNDITLNYNEYPVLESTIPFYEARITGVFPPWTKDIEMTIRMPPRKVFTLEEYLDEGKMSQDYYKRICEAILTRQNICVGGGTNSGKTTFLNAMIEKAREISPKDRFYIMQDTAELVCKSKRASFITVRRDQCLKALLLALRFSPSRILVGEIRDGQVMNTFLDLSNTGHPGAFMTVHSNTGESTILRIYQLLKQILPGELPPVSEMINLIVHLRQDVEHGVIVDEVFEPSQYDQEYFDSIASRKINSETP